MSEKHITRRSLSDRRTGQTDWARLEALSDPEIEQKIAADPDAAPLLTDEWLSRAELVPPTKRAISIRLDDDVLRYFQAGGGRYQTRINQVLRAYVDARKKSA